MEVDVTPPLPENNIDTANITARAIPKYLVSLIVFKSSYLPHFSIHQSLTYLPPQRLAIS